MPKGTTVRIRSMVDGQNAVPVALAPWWPGTSLALVISGPTEPPVVREGAGNGLVVGQAAVRPPSTAKIAP